MATIIGGITTSHVPAIGGAIAKGLQNDPYWKPFFDGFIPVRRWLAETRPDVAVVLWATRFSTHDIVEKAGTQGIELLMWLATRAALPGVVRQVHTNYHIPISNTASGLMLFETAAAKAPAHGSAAQGAVVA